MIRRAVMVRRGPGLVGTMARTAVVAGTATAVSQGVSNRMNNSAQPAPQEQAAPSNTPMNGQSDLSSQLEQLALLKAQGSLSEQEFQTAKKKILEDAAV